MKFLNIIRHAKAENNFLKNDFTRELNGRGQNDSKCLNDFLLNYSFEKHKIICSPSVRTVQTYENLKVSLNEKSHIIFQEDLYLANLEAIYDLIIKEKKSSMITLIGHNPGLTDILYFFLRNLDIPELNTSSIAQIFFSNSNEISKGKGSLNFFVKSKNNKIVFLF